MRYLVLLGVGSLVIGQAGAQVTVTINASKDASIYSSDVSASNGGGLLVTGRNGLGGLMRTLVAFDIASVVPTGATVTGAKLVLTTAGLGANGTIAPSSATLSLRRLNQNWGEGTTLPTNGGGGPASGGPAQPGDTTWTQNFFGTSNWTSAGGTVIAGISASATSFNLIGASVVFLSPQLNTDVQSMLSTPGQNFGWDIFSSSEGLTTTSAQAFSSRENGSLGPQLIVTYTPVPESATITVLALGAVAAIRRRRR